MLDLQLQKFFHPHAGLDSKVKKQQVSVVVGKAFSNSFNILLIPNRFENAFFLSF